MAESWARALHPNTLEPYSAGTAPGRLNDLAVRVMGEVGVDISAQIPKHVDSLIHVPFDYVVTVCDDAHERCPVFPGHVRVVHIGFDDPPRLAAGAADEAAALPHYRRVRDEIRAVIETLPQRLSQETTDHGRE